MDLERRFGGINRLYGDNALTRLQAMHIAVVGLGGVGSWVAEALARSGVGALTLVDMDHVAESNINRQVIAADATLGMSKVDAMAQRISAFAPSCKLHLIDDFASPENLEELFPASLKLSALADCCDQVKTKVALVSFTQQQAMLCIVAGSAGGKTQPWGLEVDDLSRTEQDPMLAKVRYQLRKQHNFPKGERQKFGVMAAFSRQAVKRQTECDAGAGLNCAGYGSVVAVTATMGFLMAGWLIDALLVPQQ